MAHPSFFSSDLDRRIRIERRTATQDAAGEAIITWVLVRTAWAHVRPMTSRERFNAQRDVAFRASTFTVRWFSGVDETHRIIFEDKEWNVTGVEELGRRQYLRISAELIE